MLRAARKRAPSVTYLQYTNPGAYPPIIHSASILQEQGWNVAFLCARPFGSSALALPRHLQTHAKFLVTVDHGFKGKLAYILFLFKALLHIARQRPDWVYLSDSIVTPIADLIKRFSPSTRLIYHEHDLPAEQTESRAAKIIAQARSNLIRTADIVVCPNASRAKLMLASADDHRDIQIVWNCPLQAEIQTHQLTMPDPKDEHELLLYYHGSLNKARLPDSVLDALCESPKFVRLVVVGYQTIGEPDFCDRWQTLAKQRGIDDRLTLLPPLPRDEVMELARSADVGLCLMPAESEDKNLAMMTGASNKIFDFLACGLFPIVSDSTEWQDAFIEPGFAVGCSPDNSESLSRAIRWCIEHRNDMQHALEQARGQLENEWNYEKQFEKVLRLMNTDRPTAP